MAELTVKLDATGLERWAEELSMRGLRNSVRRAVDQSARYARKVTIPVIAADIGVSKSKIAAATPKVVTTKAGDLSARWTVTKMRIGIADTTGATISKAGGLHASTHRVTGGGSAHLDIAKAFMIRMSNGARFVAFRKGRERLPIKGVYAEHPATALSQSGAAARSMWEKTAGTELAVRLSREIQRQFYNEKLSAATPDIAD
jgi:hypothetical protein